MYTLPSKKAKLSQREDDDDISIYSAYSSSLSSLSNNSRTQLDTSLNDLNDYVIFEILNNLSLNDLISIRLANRRLNHLVEIYFKFRLKEVMIYVADDYRRLENGCFEHKQTKFNCISPVDNFEPFLNKFLFKLTKLKCLSLNFLTISEKDLVNFSGLEFVGQTLEHLEISYCKFEKFYLTAAQSYSRFFKQLGTKLKHFVFYKNTSYILPFDYLIKSINKYLINLDTLSLDLKQFESLKFTNQRLTNCSIKNLSLHGFLYLNLDCDKFVNRLISGKHIEYLNLECLKISPTWLSIILSECSNVKVLKFSYDFDFDNSFGRSLITSNCVFDNYHFHQMIDELNSNGEAVQQFNLASKLSALRGLRELHLVEIESANVNIDPLILYLYHHFKKNNLRKLFISNYEFHVLNLKAFCYVSKNLKTLSLNEIRNCCYKSHRFLPTKQTRTLNESFTNVVTYLPNLEDLILNQFNFNCDLLKKILFKCGPHVRRLSFLRCKELKADCVELFIAYANANIERKVVVDLDRNLVCEIEQKYDLLDRICPSNLTINC